jgi:hypothetical protein
MRNLILIGVVDMRLVALPLAVVLCGCNNFTIVTHKPTNAEYVRSHNCTFVHRDPPSTIVIDGIEKPYHGHRTYACPRDILVLIYDEEEQP